MALEHHQNMDWRREHDPKGEFIASGATIHCADDATGFIEFCRNQAAGLSLKPAGSHWSLSTSTVSEGDFIETHWPGTEPVARNSGLALDMNAIVSDPMRDFMERNPPSLPHQLAFDPCLRDGIQNLFFVHLKSGTRIYEAYSLLDRSRDVMTGLAADLNLRIVGTPQQGPYDGPWGFETLGGAGGQTVFGALTTGTHGGDYRQKPIADCVMALHLVTDGGRHYWIEPSFNGLEFPLTDDDRLRQHYEPLVPGADFEIIRDDDVFNAVVVGVGRFGVVTSFVTRVVPQYCLHEHRRLDKWSKVKAMLGGGSLHHAFDTVHFPGTPSEQADDRDEFTERFGPPRQFNNRFLQIAVSLAPSAGGDRLCGVTQRWFYPPSGGEAIDPDGNLRGRIERGTAATAGRSGAYAPPDDDTETGGNTTFISRACGRGNFIGGLFRSAADQIDEIVRDNAVPAGGIAAAALGIGAGTVVLAIAGLCAALVAAAILLREIADWVDQSGDLSLAQVVDAGVKGITGNPAIPHEVAIMLLRALFNMIFETEQSKRDYVATSYAVMDAHDYLDRSCFGNAESIEVFFDASRPDLYCAYVDQILGFEAFQQEQRGVFSVGYVSLRYVLGSDALIAPTRFPETVVLEVAALREASGSMDFVMNAARVARSPVYNASFHWGQFNPLREAEVARHYGTRLERWRNVLRDLTEGGARNAFSSDFTRRTGLEP